MCGICGFVGPENPSVLAAMRDSLHHRGPDESGEFSTAEVSLGHRRLSIIDLSGGSQPVFNEDRSIALVFNGEIYNHLDLRRTLEDRGHRYVSHCDSETIVHAYEEYGVDCVDHLDGMFAFVAYDMKRRLLFGARDRLGKKPLYYTERPFSGGGSAVSFAFASEIKALRRHPAVESGIRMNPGGLASYLVNDYVAGRSSIFTGIAKLEAGSAFTFGLDGSASEGLRTWRYWEIAIGARDSGMNAVSTNAVSEREAGETVLDLLDRAVERRLMADVPLGAFLSGGIDSSAIVGLLARKRPPSQIKTFAIGFDDPSFDESEYAARVAQRFGTEHHTCRFTAGDLIGRIPRVIRLLDEPFADPSILPVSMLCEFARERVTVALSGDGGDELFAGYDPFRALTAARLYGRFTPAWLHQRIAVPLTRLLPASAANMAARFRAERFLRGAMLPLPVRLSTWMGAFSLEQLARLAPDLLHEAEGVLAPAIEVSQRLAGHNDLDIALDFFERYYLPDDILVKVDRASMMNSLEVRSPFLDTALVEYVNALPNHFKFRRGVGKYLLKKAVTTGNGSAPLLSSDIAYRRKKGFGIPVARWIRHDLADIFRERLIEAWPSKLDMFNSQEIRRLLDRHTSGRENNYKELWALFVLSLWASEH